MSSEKISTLLADVSIEGDIVEKDKIIIDAKINGDIKSNDVITQNGSTKGGLAGSIVVVTAIASAKYHVAAQLLGSGTLVTPFADA